VEPEARRAAGLRDDADALRDEAAVLRGDAAVLRDEDAFVDFRADDAAGLRVEDVADLRVEDAVDLRADDGDALRVVRRLLEERPALDLGWGMKSSYLPLVRVDGREATARAPGR
jgi:hypothetical protein